MAVWFVSRHPGATDWARSQGIAVDHWATHLSVGEIAAGDIVMGILPVNLASVVCARGARYFNLSLDLSFASRGKELNMADLIAAGARLEEYSVSLVR